MRAASVNDSATDMAELCALFETFSIGSRESKVLAGLVHLGWATPMQLSRLTGISRPTVYPVLESLTFQNLVARKPDSRGTWICPEVDELLARLRSSEARRLDEAQESLSRRTSQAQAFMARLAGSGDSGPPTLSLVEEARLVHMYEEAMAWVRTEILVFNRGPYTGDIVVSPAVLSAVERGVKARALYQAFELAGPDCELRAVVEVYAAAGVELRVAESLPVSLAVLDRTLALMKVPESEDSDLAYLGSVVVHNPGVAGLLADSFDSLWPRSKPYAAHAKRSRRTAPK